VQLYYEEPLLTNRNGLGYEVIIEIGKKWYAFHPMVCLPA
jgi:hypothetical protein